MANRSLGVLTLDLIARIGGWQKGFDQAARIAKTKSSEMESAFNKVGAVFGGLIKTFSAGFLLHKFVEETSKAQEAMAQLRAVVASTGNSAGFTIDQLERMSKEFQNTTRYSDEAAKGVQAILLQMTRLQGGQFVKALQLIGDVSTRTGRDLNEVATVFGRALSGSARGIDGLRKLRIRLTAARVEELKSITDESKKAEIVLKEIQKAYGGAAAADIKTLGGAISQLKNKFDDLFEADSESTRPLVAAINLVAQNLELLASILTKAAIAYGVYKATLIGAELVNAAKNFYTLYNAVKAGTAVLISQEAINAASVISSNKAAIAKGREAAAEVERLEAIVLGNRATVERIALDEASTASAATRATVIRNLAKSEAALAAAQVKNFEAQGAAAVATVATSNAQKQLAVATDKNRQATKLLLGPFNGIIAFARANPYTAIAAAVITTTAALYSYRNEIKLSTDGVVTLANASSAVLALLKERYEGLGVSVRHAFEAAKEFATAQFGGIIDQLKPILDILKVFKFEFPSTEEVFRKLIRIIPGVGSALDALLPSFEAINKKAREIAAAEAKLRDEQAKAQAAALKREQEAEAASKAQAAAIAKIKELTASLRGQIENYEQGAVAAAKYRIEHGDLADDFRKAGTAVKGYKEEILELTDVYEKIQAAKTIDKFAKDLQKQIDLYGKGETAALEYALVHDEELVKAFEKFGASADDVRQSVLGVNAELQKLKIADKLRDINIELLELHGQTKEAIKLKFEADFREFRDDLEKLPGDAGKAGLALIKLFEDTTIANADAQEHFKETSRILDDLALQEERIRNSQEVGALSELDAMFALDEERERAVGLLQKELDALEAIPPLIRSIEAEDGIKKLTNDIEKLKQQSGLLATQIQGELKEAFTEMLGDVLKGTKSLGDAFQDMINRIKNYFLDLIAQDFAGKLFGTGGPLAGAGAFFASLFKDKGGFIKPGQFGIVGERGPEIVIGGKQGVSVTSRIETRRMFEMMRDMIAALPRRDAGGFGYPGQPVMIGTGAQPEMFTPSVPGRFTPRANIGAQTNIFHFSISAPQGSISRATQQQIGAEAARAVARAARRNG